MNIGIFTDTYTPQINGVVISIQLLVKGLRENGHNVYIFTAKDPHLKELPQDKIHEEYAYRFPSIPVIFSPEHRLAVGYSRKLYKEIKSLNLDVIHTHTEFSIGILGKIMAKRLNVPLIHTYHTMWSDYAHYITRVKNDKINTPVSACIQKFSKAFCNNSKAVIAPTEITRKALTSYGVKKPIMVIPTGINLKPFREPFSMMDILKLKKDVGLKTMDKVVLSIGRVAEEKSIDVIIKAFPKVVEKIPQAKFLIIGDGPARSDLEALTRKLGLENNIVFAGKKPYELISKFYKLGDVFVNASTTETQGLTYIEAMAAGIPVVAKYAPNLDGIIEHAKSGLLFHNDSEVADMIITILSDKKLKDTVIKGATEVADECSDVNFVKKVEVAYQSLINAK